MHMPDWKSRFHTGSRGRPLREVIAEAAADVQRLVVQHVELAKAELRQAGRRIAAGVGLLAAAALLASLALFFLSLAAWWGLGLLIGNAWSGLAIGVFLLIIAVILIAVGAAKLKQLSRTPETVESVKHTVQGLRTGKDV